MYIPLGYDDNTIDYESIIREQVLKLQSILKEDDSSKKEIEDIIKEFSSGND